MPGIKWGAGAPACASPDVQLRKESAASSPLPTRIFYWSLQSGSLNATFSIFLTLPPRTQGAHARLRLPHLPRKRKPAVISREATAVIWDQEEQSIHRPTSPSILGKFPGRQAGRMARQSAPLSAFSKPIQRRSRTTSARRWMWWRE